MPDVLTSEQTRALNELVRLAGDSDAVTAKQLREAKFAEFVFSVQKQQDAGYLDAQQTRVLQELRNKGYLTINKGKYTITKRPETPPPAEPAT